MSWSKSDGWFLGKQEKEEEDMSRYRYHQTGWQSFGLGGRNREGNERKRFVGQTRRPQEDGGGSDTFQDIHLLPHDWSWLSHTFSGKTSVTDRGRHEIRMTMITTITMTSRVFTKFMLSIVSMSCIQSLSVSLTPCDTLSVTGRLFQCLCPYLLRVTRTDVKRNVTSFGFSLNFSPNFSLRSHLSFYHSVSSGLPPLSVSLYLLPVSWKQRYSIQEKVFWFSSRMIAILDSVLERKWEERDPIPSPFLFIHLHCFFLFFPCFSDSSCSLFLC